MLKKETFKEELINLILAGYGCFAVQTLEERRVREELSLLTDSLSEIYKEEEVSYRLVQWSASAGYIDENDIRKGDDKVDPGMLWSRFIDAPDGALLLVLDYHHYISKAITQRWIRDIGYLSESKEVNKKIIFVSPSFDFTKDISEAVHEVEFSLPDEAAIIQAIRYILGSVETLGEDAPYHVQLVDACKGMTQSAMQNALALAVRKCKNLEDYNTVKIVRKAKADDLSKSGMVRYEEPEESADDVGGMLGAKEWAKDTGECITPEALAFGCDPVDGVLLTGPPGTGKSLFSRVVANIFQIPLLIFDPSTTKSKWQGESQSKLRDLFRIVNAFGKCVLRIDEIEKAFAGSQSSEGDSGVGAQQLAQWLTFLEEDKAPGVVVVATSNDGGKIPGPMLRDKRLSTLFYVPLPDEEARKEIFAIHLNKKGRDTSNFNLEELAAATDNFSGAEVEGVVKEGIRLAFARGKGKVELSNEHMQAVINSKTPVAELHMEDVERNIEWAKGRCWNANELKYENTKVKTSKKGGSKKRNIKMKTGFDVLDD